MSFNFMKLLLGMSRLPVHLPCNDFNQESDEESNFGKECL